MNGLLARPQEQFAAGIVTASGGNHGLAVTPTAFAAGVPATTTMAFPRTQPQILEIVREHVDRILPVSDEEMEQASQWLWFKMGIAADLSGASSIALLRRGIPELAGAKKICTLICGAGAEATARQPAA